VSPIESRTSRTSATAFSGDRSGGGSRRAMSKAHSRECGSTDAIGFLKLMRQIALNQARAECDDLCMRRGSPSKLGDKKNKSERNCPRPLHDERFHVVLSLPICGGYQKKYSIKFERCSKRGQAWQPAAACALHKPIIKRRACQFLCCRGRHARCPFGSKCPVRVVCHERRRSKRRRATVREMKEGPSGSAIRC
jgi:hypothetical protein